MDGLEAMHDGTAAARGWSPQQLHRLNSYLLGGDAEDGGGYHQALGDESVLKHALLPATSREGQLLQQGRDVHTSDLDALGAATANAGEKTPSTEEGGRKRSSRFRGVTKHRRSGRYEAHVWLKDTGKQVYLGGFEKEEFAAEAFDIACLKAKGHTKARACGLLAKINFPIETYAELLPYLASVSMEELVMAVRRQSQGFARGTSTFRGVTRHPNGRWEARMGVPGSRHIYLGLFEVEEEAARAYDRALVRLRGPASATNFSLSDYGEQLREYEAERAPSEMPAQPSASALEWPFESDDLCC